MSPSNATIELYRGRDGLWRARVEWTDAETGEQRCEEWRERVAKAYPEGAARQAALRWANEVGL